MEQHCCYTQNNNRNRSFSADFRIGLPGPSQKSSKNRKIDGKFTSESTIFEVPSVPKFDNFQIWAVFSIVSAIEMGFFRGRFSIKTRKKISTTKFGARTREKLRTTKFGTRTQEKLRTTKFSTRTREKLRTTILSYLVLYCLIFLSIIAIPVGIVCWLTGGNYMYLARIPAVDNPIVFGEWPYYIIYLGLIGIIFMLIAKLPFDVKNFFDRRKS